MTAFSKMFFRVERLHAILCFTTCLESLVVSKDSFVDKELREHFSDIIYQVDLKQGDSAYIYLLFEHKSYSDPLIALHLLRYMIKIWVS
jgi:predicted transposase/invertase (TIGR01784 family)